MSDGGPGRRDASLSVVELRLLGGAASRETRTPSAVGARDATRNLFASASANPALSGKRAAVAHVVAALDAWRGPENLINFVGHANDVADIDRSWSASQRSRFDTVRRTVDPHGLLGATALSI